MKIQQNLRQKTIRIGANLVKPVQPPVGKALSGILLSSFWVLLDRPNASALLIFSGQKKYP